MNNFMALYINKKVEMLKKICSEERDGYWCKLGSSKCKLWIWSCRRIEEG